MDVPISIASQQNELIIGALLVAVAIIGVIIMFAKDEPQQPFWLSSNEGQEPWAMFVEPCGKEVFNFALHHVREHKCVTDYVFDVQITHRYDLVVFVTDWFTALGIDLDDGTIDKLVDDWKGQVK